MPAIIENSFRHYQSENFLEAFSEASSDVIYLYIGESDPWSGLSVGEYYGGEGINYTTVPTATISGDGTGATATPVINADGQITSIGIDAGGSGYTAATIAITGGGGIGGAATVGVNAGAVDSITLVPVDESNPPTPNDSFGAYFQNYDQIIAMKRIPASAVSHVIKRVDWTTGTIYDQYEDHVNDIEDRDYFVMTTDFNVYKCISNNSGATSTIQPTGQSTSVVTTADSYKWKFITEVRSADILTFLTTDWIPVRAITSDDSSQQWLVQAAATDGSIDHVKITNGGSGYAGDVPTVAAVGGGGSGFTATATETAGVVDGITISAAGTGYRPGTTISLTGGGGSGATADPIIGPIGGHGSNAKNELGGFFIMLSVDLIGADGSGDLPVGDDFRQVGLLLNPEVAAAQATATTYSIGEIDDNSGRIIYLENRKLINRAADQTEAVRLVVAF